MTFQAIRLEGWPKNRLIDLIVIWFILSRGWPLKQMWDTNTTKQNQACLHSPKRGTLGESLKQFIEVVKYLLQSHSFCVLRVPHWKQQARSKKHLTVQFINLLSVEATFNIFPNSLTAFRNLSQKSSITAIDGCLNHYISTSCCQTQQPTTEANLCTQTVIHRVTA